VLLVQSVYIQYRYQYQEPHRHFQDVQYLHSQFSMSTLLIHPFKEHFHFFIIRYYFLNSVIPISMTYHKFRMKFSVSSFLSFYFVIKKHNPSQSCHLQFIRYSVCQSWIDLRPSSIRFKSLSCLSIITPYI